MWYERRTPHSLLRPLGGLYCGIMQLRRAAYRRGLLPSAAAGVPVIVVGNLTVGGTGKTPLVLWLAAWLQTQGYRPGLLARGYRGRSRVWPQLVTPASDPVLVGDEPVLLARRSGLPVAAGPERIRAAQALLAAYPACNLLVSDDGLQHYALRRELEVLVIDAVRGFGNGACLPAGPLREPECRAREVDFVIRQGAVAPAESRAGEFGLRLASDGSARRLGDDGALPLAAWRGQRVHAIAGIGHPERFFALLRAQGLQPIAHPLPDHHAFCAADIVFDDGLPVLMTEKDAVKCRRYARPYHAYVPVHAEPDAGFGPALLHRLQERLHG